MSIVAIKAALFGGKPPEHRLERLRRFWEIVSSSLPDFPLWRGERLRELVDEWSAAWVAMAGVPGFFRPSMMPPLLALPRSEERRVGKECVRTGRSRCSPSHSKKKYTNTAYFTQALNIKKHYHV